MIVNTIRRNVSSVISIFVMPISQLQFIVKFAIEKL